MKKRRSVMVYNVLFPTWFLLYLLPSHLILLMLAGNFIIDSLVLLLAARWQKLDHKRVIWKKSILRIWLLGFVSDLLGALANLGFYLGLVALEGAGILSLSGFNPLLFPGTTLTALPGVILAGLLIYWFNRFISFRKTGLTPDTIKKLCLVLAIVTAPYAMLIPLYG